MVVQSRDVGKICQFELKGVPISFQYLAKLNGAGTKLSNPSVCKKMKTLVLLMTTGV